MNSSSSQRFGVLSICAAFTLGSIATVGLWIGWTLWSPKPTNPESVSNEASVNSKASKPSEVEESESPTPVQAKSLAATLEEITQVESEFSRNLALYKFALEVSEDELLDLVDLSSSLPARFRFEPQRIFVQRLFEVNPELTLSRAENFHTALVQSIFRQWAQTDLDDAIARAKNLQGETREAATIGILSHKPEISAEEQAEISRELGEEELSSGFALSQQISQIQRDPEKAWSEALGDGTYDSDQLRILVITAVSWVRQSGLGVVEEISASLEEVQVRVQVLGSVLATAMQFTEPEVVFAKALELESDPENLLLRFVVERWSSSSPESALLAMSEVESHSLRKQLQQVVVRNWAHTDPRSILGELDLIPTDLRARTQENALKTIARSSPEEAISLTLDLETSGNKLTLISEIASIWAEQDPDAALAWALANQEISFDPSELVSSVVTGWSLRDPSAALDWILTEGEWLEFRSYTIADILRNLSDVDPEIALQRALEQPIEPDRLGLEHQVISHIAQNDFRLAKAMLQRTREGQTRVNSYAAVGIAMVSASHGKEALDLAHDLVDTDRASYVSTILSQWIEKDAHELVDTLSQISDPEIQSSAATKLIAKDDVTGILSEDQVEHVSKYLVE